MQPLEKKATRPPDIVAIETVVTSTLQPRTVFEDEALDELKQSMLNRGIIEPLVVRPRGARWELVCGERRYRAALALGLKQVPIRALELSDDEAYLMAVEENVHRESLSPLDEARAYRQILRSGKVVSQRALARLLSVSQARVSQRLALLDMPDAVIEAMAANGAAKAKLTERHARELRRLTCPQKQTLLARHVVDRALTVEQTRALVLESKGAAPLGDPEPIPGLIAADLAKDGTLVVRIEAGSVTEQAVALRRLARRITRVGAA